MKKQRRILKILKKFKNYSGHDYRIVGSYALMVHNALEREPVDINIIVESKQAQKALKEIFMEELSLIPQKTVFTAWDDDIYQCWSQTGETDFLVDEEGNRVVSVEYKNGLPDPAETDTRFCSGEWMIKSKICDFKFSLSKNKYAVAEEEEQRRVENNNKAKKDLLALDKKFDLPKEVRELLSQEQSTAL